MASAIPGQRIIDPNAPGRFGLANALQLSGLSITRAQAGVPLDVSFTATAVDHGGAVYDANDTIMGIVTDVRGAVVATLPGINIAVGPFGDAINGNQYRAEALASNGPLPLSLSKQTVYAYVGPQSELGAYPVGVSFAPNLDVMLQAGAQVAAAPAGSSGSGSGSGGSGGGFGSGGSVPPPSPLPPVPTPTPAPGFWTSLSTSEKVGLAGGGILFAGGVAYLLTAGRR